MIYINGRFLTQKITGVQRYATEVLKEMDKIVKDEVIILHPKGCINRLKLKNIKFKQIGCTKGHLWEQVTLPLYIMRHNRKAKLINFCNIAPILFPGYVVLHDVSFKTHPEHLNWKFSLWYKIITKLNINKYKHIFTVSEFSKLEIMKEYNVKSNRITVTYNSAEHIRNTKSNDEILEKLDLKNNEFNFTVGSKSPHKNLKYIVELAKNNRNEMFVISGDQNKIFNNVEEEELENIKYTGYISDNELVALYKSCKRFIFPSLYEGFGIPPLEALNLECESVIVSDIPVFREIYNECVQYIDVNKNELSSCLKYTIQVDKNKINELISKYTWKNITKTIVKELGE